MHMFLCARTHTPTRTHAYRGIPLVQCIRLLSAYSLTHGGVKEPHYTNLRSMFVKVCGWAGVVGGWVSLRGGVCVSVSVWVRVCVFLRECCVYVCVVCEVCALRKAIT